ncbi:hypothetical protein PT2222_60057 [Paraburkholderia tropica]
MNVEAMLRCCGLLAEVDRLHAVVGGAHCGDRRARSGRTVRHAADGVVLRGNLGFGGKDVVGVVRVVAARRAIAGLFELDEFGANLGAGQRAIRLGERSNRDNESNGNCNGLDQGLHDYYLRGFLVFGWADLSQPMTRV